MSREEDVPTNASVSASLREVAAARMSRRELLRGAATATAAGALARLGGGTAAGALWAACGDDDQAPAQVPGRPAKLGFTAVPKSVADALTVPAGYTARVLIATGDPLATGIPAYANNGTDPAASFLQRVGDHHDGMAFFSLDDRGQPAAPDRGVSDRGLLCVNHESTSPLFIHPQGPTTTEGRRPVPEEVLREIYLCGVTVVEVRRQADGSWVHQPGSPYNRRVNAATEIELSGPLRGAPAMVTRFSPDGTRTRGTVQNCSSGKTPWGTYLTCEENWAGQFWRLPEDDAQRTPKELLALARYGVGGPGRFLWSTPSPDTADDEFGRWNAQVRGATETDDYRNVANTFGWIVEIDPYARGAAPRKRTAMGRFARESATAAIPQAGKPVVFYSGDDTRNEYLYKFVSAQPWDPADASAATPADRLALGDKYLDHGTLYAARFLPDGTGVWLELALGKHGIGFDSPGYPFDDARDVALHTRLAADVAGATRMDRPEWVAVDPLTGAVYATLTNSVAARPLSGLDAANPRYYSDPRTDGGVVTQQWGNPNGHIVRWLEPSPEATTFVWDIYLFGAGADADRANVNVSSLSADNDFSSPDGLWFSPTTSICWIETDDQSATDVSNCMLLAALPGAVGDGVRVAIHSADETGARRRVFTQVGAAPRANLRRFLVGPVGCEITGLCESPDGTALFVNIQHPGDGSASPDAPRSSWPSEVAGARPRSATLVITRDDGGVIGL